MNVIKAFPNTVIFKFIEKHIPKRNPSNLMNVIKPFPSIIIYKFIREDILERNLTSVFSVCKSFQSMVIYKRIKESTLEKKSYEGNGCEPFYNAIISECVSEHNEEKD